jgi:hypothetical protein
MGPQHAFPHRLTRREFGQNLPEVLIQWWSPFKRRLAPPPFFRARLGAASSVGASSIKPRRMVFGSIPNKPEIYSRPPWPNLAASIPAERRRSFSDSVANSHCIFNATAFS